MVDANVPAASRRPAAALLAAAFAVGVVACAKDAPPPPRPPALVVVDEARREVAPIELTATGSVEARSTVSVSARVAGQVTRVHFAEGDEVQRGQVLFSIDPRPFQTALAQAQAQLERNRVLADNASREAARYAELVEKDFVTREQHDRVQAEARALQAGLAANQAAIADARLQLEHATVRAPITGRAGSILVHAGNNVRANEQPLVVLHQMEPVEVKFAIPQRDLAEVRRRMAGGAALPVVAREPGGAERQGTLTFVDHSVDSTSGTIFLKATFDNRDRALWPGQLVQVVLRLGEEEAVLAPEAAVQSGQKGDFVFVVTDDGTVESRPVQVARSLGSRVVIAEGLSGGEQVVTEGHLRVTPGAKVTVRPAAGEAPAGAAVPAAAGGRPGR